MSSFSLFIKRPLWTIPICLQIWPHYGDCCCSWSKWHFTGKFIEKLLQLRGATWSLFMFYLVSYHILLKRVSVKNRITKKCCTLDAVISDFSHTFCFWQLFCTNNLEICIKTRISASSKDILRLLLPICLLCTISRRISLLLYKWHTAVCSFSPKQRDCRIEKVGGVHWRS